MNHSISALLILFGFSLLVETFRLIYRRMHSSNPVALSLPAFALLTGSWSLVGLILVVLGISSILHLDVTSDHLARRHVFIAMKYSFFAFVGFSVVAGSELILKSAMHLRRPLTARSLGKLLILTILNVALAILFVSMIYASSTIPFISIGRISPAEITKAATVLGESGFLINRDFSISDDGLSLLVLATKRNEASLRLARAGFFRSSEDPDTSPETSARNREAIMTVVRQAICSIDGVADFRISVAHHKSSDSLSEVPVTASGIITFDSGYSPTETQITTIRSLVIGSVHGLSDMTLTLTDASGADLHGVSSSAPRLPLR